MTSKNIFWSVVLIAIALYGAMLGWSIPKISADTDGLLPFDLRPGGYTFEEARSFLAALSEEGSAFYQNVQHMLDALFPLFEAAAIGWGIFLLLPPTWWRWPLALVPLPGTIFDYLENAMVGEMLKVGVEGLTTDMVQTASYYTQMKSAFVTLSIVTLLVAIGWWFIRRMQPKKVANQ